MITNILGNWGWYSTRVRVGGRVEGDLTCNNAHKLNEGWIGNQCYRVFTAAEWPRLCTLTLNHCTIDLGQQCSSGHICSSPYSLSQSTGRTTQSFVTPCLPSRLLSTPLYPNPPSSKFAGQNRPENLRRYHRLSSAEGLRIVNHG